MKRLTKLLPLLLFFASCTYDPQGVNENKEVQPPDVSAINVEIDVATHNDTIEIYGPTTLTFSAGVNSSLLSIANSEITYNNDWYISSQSPQSLTLSPYYASASKIYTLTVKLHFKPESNSIAGQAGAEIFEGTHVYYIKYFDFNTLKLNVETRITPDSILECFWDFENLPLQLKDNLTSFSIDYGPPCPPNQRSLQITDYYGDSDRQINVTAYFSLNNKFVSGSTQVIHYEPQVTLKAHGTDSVKISWTKIYRSYNEILEPNTYKVIVPLTSATSAIVPRPLFGSYNFQARLNTRSYTMEWWSPYFVDFDLRSLTKIQENSGDINYSVSTNQIYYSTYLGKFTVYQLPKWAVKTNIQLTNINNIRVCQHCAALAMLAYNRIVMYPTGNLTDEPVIIPLRQAIDVLQVVDKHTIAYIDKSFNYEKGTFKLYDISTQTILQEVTLPYSQWVISPDGRFVLCYFENKFEVYEIKEQANLVFSKAYNRSYVDFHPTEKNVLVIENNNQVQLLNLVGNTQQDYAIGARFLVNIDPLTGNFLLTDNAKLHVYSPSSRTIIYSMPYDNSSSISLLGNSLISNGQGVDVLDISNALTK